MSMCMHMHVDIERFRHLVRGQGEGDQVHGRLLEFAQSSEPLQRLKRTNTPIHVCEGTSTQSILVEHMRYRVS